MAVAGLPEARDDHAVVMAKFARDCRLQMMELVRDLEKTLGPGTYVADYSDFLVASYSCIGSDPLAFLWIFQRGVETSFRTA